jgi:hypothetical protein
VFRAPVQHRQLFSNRPQAVGPSLLESTSELRLYPGNSRTLGVSESLLSRFMSGSGRWLGQETLDGLAKVLNLEVEAGKSRRNKTLFQAFNRDKGGN